MAPVIANGINSTGGANTKGSQSTKMHSKVVGVTLFSFYLYESVCLESVISTSFWYVRDVGTAFEWDVHCVRAY